MPESPWRLIRGLLAPQRRLIALFAAVLAVATLVPLASALLLGRVVKLAVQGAPAGRIVPYTLAYAGLGLLGPAMIALVTWRGTVLAWGITNGLRHELADHVLSADLAFHRDRTPGELVTRVDADVTAMTTFLATVVAQVIAIAALAIGVVIVGAVATPRLAPALAVGCALLGGVTWRVRDLSVEQTVVERAAEADVMGAAEQYLSGADDLAALGAGLHAVARIGEHHSTLVEAAKLRARAMMSMQGAIRVATAAAEVIVIAYGAVLLRAGRVDVAAVVFGYRLIEIVARRIEHLQWRLQEASGASGAARRVLSLLAERRAVPEGSAALPPGPLDLSFDAVTLVYDDGDGSAAALADLVLRVPAGRVLGLVGRSGSGKTSLARLTLRLVEPTLGAVRLGGADLATVTEDALRAAVVAVPQDVQLFPGSVRDNVTLFAERADADVLRALDAVGLGDWVAGLPDELSTLVAADSRDDHGTRTGLSAGQAQLLALSRALLRDPRVVVLDEATSRIDPATQAALTAAIDRLLHGRTGVVIAHRLETLDRCDDIAVLADGVLVEHGPRVVLAADPSSHYARLRAVGAESEELV